MLWNNTFYFAPGINLDNTWQAELGVKIRGIDGQLTGSQAFAYAKGLATKQSVQFLKVLEDIMDLEGLNEFWNKVKSTISFDRKEDQYEKFNHFPFLFVSAGLPPDVEALEDSGYYLRVIIRTANGSFSGTDADIKLIAQGKSFTLDYLAKFFDMNLYNDLERGDEVVYLVGPFDSLPTSVEIKNDAPDLSDQWPALKESIGSWFETLGEAIKGFFANDADYVGTKSFTMDPKYLNMIVVGDSKEETVTIDGGSEGKYEVVFKVKRYGHDIASRMHQGKRQ